MDLLSLLGSVSKIGDLLEQIIRTRKGYQSHRVLRRLVRAYVRLGDVLEANKEINKYLDALIKYKDLQPKKADFAALNYLLERLQYFAQSTVVNLSKAIEGIAQSRDILEMLYDEMEAEKSDAFHNMESAVQAQLRSLAALSASVAAEIEKLQIQRGYESELPTLQFTILSPDTKDTTTITVDLNKEGYAKQLENAREKFVNRKSLSYLPQARLQIKKIIQDHWQTEDILDAMNAEEKD
jgi:hypothetical protein